MEPLKLLNAFKVGASADKSGELSAAVRSIRSFTPRSRAAPVPTSRVSFPPQVKLHMQVYSSECVLSNLNERVQGVMVGTRHTTARNCRGVGIQRHGVPPIHPEMDPWGYVCICVLCRVGVLCRTVILTMGYKSCMFWVLDR